MHTAKKVIIILYITLTKISSPRFLFEHGIRNEFGWIKQRGDSLRINWNTAKKNYGSLLGITRIDKITQMDYNFFGVASISLEFGITVGHIEKNGTN